MSEVLAISLGENGEHWFFVQDKRYLVTPVRTNHPQFSKLCLQPYPTSLAPYADVIEWIDCLQKFVEAGPGTFGWW